MIRNDGDLEDGEVSEDESEEIVDHFENRRLGSSDKENLNYSDTGIDDDGWHKEERRWVVKEKKRVVSQVGRNWEGGRIESREKEREKSNLVVSSHSRKNWHPRHEDKGHGERSKSRKEERRLSLEEDDAGQRNEKLEKMEIEKSYEENGRKSRSLGEVDGGGRDEKWRNEALAKTNFSPVAFLMEEMEKEEEMEKKEEERRKKRRILDCERQSETEEKRNRRLKTERLRFRDDFRRHFEVERQGGKVRGRSWGEEERQQKRRIIKNR